MVFEAAWYVWYGWAVLVWATWTLKFGGPTPENQPVIAPYSDVGHERLPMVLQ